MTIEKHLHMLAPSGADVLSAQHGRPLKPFAPEVMNFLGELSETLSTDPRVRGLPDVYSFGFWCRRNALERMRRSYSEHEYRLGRGLVFHISPANVPVNFAYSLVAGLLAGNSNIIRVPSVEFTQVKIMIEAIDALLNTPAHRSLRDHIRLVRYDREREDITAAISKICDVRVIWGGDDSIDKIRTHLVPPRAFDITFADRYSVCIINVDRYLSQANPLAVAEGFYNDTYLFDQNACTAPHLVLWWGTPELISKARQTFWDALHAHVLVRGYTLEADSAMAKWAHALQYVALNTDSRIVTGQDNLITRIEIKKLTSGIEDWHGNCGFFFEHTLEDLETLATIANRRYQTLSYYGFEKEDLQKIVLHGRASGIDRIVPIGRTLEFSLFWDGYDLVRSLSRLITAN
jgi:hypothetical protein